MRFNRQKAFPNPVLRPYSDDYLSSDLQFIPEPFYDENTDQINFNFQFVTSAQELLERIESQDAAFVVIVSCRDTFLKEPKYSSDSFFSISFPAGWFRGRVSIEAYIIAQSLIDDFHSSDINPEFGPGPFKYEPGEVMALDEHKEFSFDREAMKPISTVLELVIEDGLQKDEWQIRFEEDNLQIAVNPQIKQQIDTARNNKKNIAIFLNSIYFSAVMEAVNIIKYSNDYDGLKWCRVMRQKCANEGVSLENDFSYHITQILLKRPFGLLKTYVLQEEQ